MANHREIVGRSFRVGGWLMGVPSALLLVAVVLGLAFGHVPAANDPAMQKGGYRSLQMFFGTPQGVHDALSFFGVVGGIAGVVFAVALIFVIGLAVAIWFTGRGISRHEKAARVLGIVWSGLFLLAWLAALVSAQGAGMIVPVIGVAVAGYFIWVLGWK
jgi:hypothetical protein